MRPTLPALALALVACGPPDGRDTSDGRGAPSAASLEGPDPIVLRAPRAGGPVRAYVYPRLDSVIWTSAEPAPPLERVLAFDDDAGSLAYVDARGQPGRIDLRLGGVGRATRQKLASLASADGYAIYGVSEGSVTRLTPAGDWPYRPPASAREVFPQRDGALIVSTLQGDSMTLWRLHPPDDRVLDTAVLVRGERGLHTQASGNLYFAAGSRLVGVRARDLSPVREIQLDAPVAALATTPSGDRIFAAIEDSAALEVIGRYREEVERELALPGPAAELRMDPLGRYLLARPERGDSAWVIDVGTDRIVGAVRTAWRTDLPRVAPDGAILTVRGDDVVLVDGATLRDRETIDGGAADFWFLVRWNGFRPRAAGLDEPVTFEGADSTDTSFVAADTGAVPDSAGAVAADTGAPAARPAPRPAPPANPGFVVQFASVLREDLAQAAAAKVHVGSETPRIVSSKRGAVTIYRVILGPYPTREEAERIGRASGLSYWVYEGVP